MTSCFFAAVVAAWLAAGGVDGLDPAAPIAPTSHEQCEALTREWEVRTTALYEQEKACDQRASDQLQKCPMFPASEYERCSRPIIKPSLGDWGVCPAGSLYYSCEGIHKAKCDAYAKRDAQLQWCRQAVNNYQKQQEQERQRQEEAERQRQEAQRQAEQYTNQQRDRIEKSGDATRDVLQRQGDAAKSNIDTRTASLQQQRDYYAGLQDQRKKDADSSYDRMRQYLNLSSQTKDQHAALSGGDRGMLQSLGDAVSQRADDARRAAADWLGLPSTPTPETSVLTDILRAPARKFADYGMEQASSWAADRTGTRDLLEAGKEFKNSIVDPAFRIDNAIESAKDWVSFVSRNVAGQTTPDENLDHSVSLVKAFGEHAFPRTPVGGFASAMASFAIDYTVAVNRSAMRDLETAFAEFDRQIGSSGSTFSSNWNWRETSYATLRSTYVPLTAYDRRKLGLPATGDDQEPDRITSGYDEFFSFFKH